MIYLAAGLLVALVLACVWAREGWNTAESYRLELRATEQAHPQRIDDMLSRHVAELVRAHELANRQEQTLLNGAREERLAIQATEAERYARAFDELHPRFITVPPEAGKLWVSEDDELAKGRAAAEQRAADAAAAAEAVEAELAARTQYGLS